MSSDEPPCPAPPGEQHRWRLVGGRWLARKPRVGPPDGGHDTVKGNHTAANLRKKEKKLAKSAELEALRKTDPVAWQKVIDAKIIAGKEYEAAAKRRELLVAQQNAEEEVEEVEEEEEEEVEEEEGVAPEGDAERRELRATERPEEEEPEAEKEEPAAEEEGDALREGSAAPMSPEVDYD